MSYLRSVGLVDTAKIHFLDGLVMFSYTLVCVSVV